MVAASFLLAALLHADMNSLVPSGGNKQWNESKSVGKRNQFMGWKQPPQKNENHPKNMRRSKSVLSKNDPEKREMVCNVALKVNFLRLEESLVEQGPGGLGSM